MIATWSMLESRKTKFLQRITSAKTRIENLIPDGATMVLANLRFTALLLLLSRVANAFPTGAGGCLGGGAAVGGAHLTSSNIVNGSLADGRIRFELDGDELRENEPLYIRVGKRTSLVMTAPFSGVGIKGFLIRLSSGDSATSDYDLTDALSPPTVREEQQPYVETKVVESLCADSEAAGLTHSNANPKYVISGEILITQDIESELLLDVTAVLENSDTKSEYYYSQFHIKAKTFTQPPTVAPATGTKFLVYGEHPLSAAHRHWHNPTQAALLSGLLVALGGWAVARML